MPELTLQQAMQSAVEHHKAGRLPAAERLYRHVLSHQPNHADALYLLGVIANQLEKPQSAVALIERAITINPGVPDFHNSLGLALGKLGHHDAAISAYRKAISLRLGFADAYANLASSLRRTLQTSEAIAASRMAVELQPGSEISHINLGAALYDAGLVPEAIASFQKATQVQPSSALAHSNLSVVLRDAGLLDQAIAAARQAVSLSPDFPDALVNLANALKDAGLIEKAVAACRSASTLAPDFFLPGSNLLYFIYFHPDYSPQMILSEHRRWAQRHADPLLPSPLHFTNDRSPDRRLKIGYVSPDFRNHPVGRFLLPLLANHDHQQFEIHCYDSGRKTDEITARLRATADHWHETPGLSDDALATLVRQHQIDILVDLTLHMAGSRLLAFARKPAPLQVTWLGYAGTTGLRAIDYRLSDPYLDPPSLGDGDYVEQTFRIPSYWCYEPLAQSPDVQPLPALQNCCITFGCLNHFSKVSVPTLHLWARLLQKVPCSRILIFSFVGSQRERALKIFALAGIDPSRILFVSAQHPSEYLKQYHQIDIGLDTLPYGGGTTTCDALWMGVPVITLSGKTAVGRGGVSLLNQLGLDELIAHSAAEYLDIAAGLAGDASKLTALRANLRPAMSNSALMNAPQFARSIESAFRQMWQQWCAR